MKKPKKLNHTDFMFGAIEPTEQNFNILVKEYNNLVEVVNYLYDMVLQHQKGLDDKCLEILDDN